MERQFYVEIKGRKNTEWYKISDIGAFFKAIAKYEEMTNRSLVPPAKIRQFSRDVGLKLPFPLDREKIEPPWMSQKLQDRRGRIYMSMYWALFDAQPYAPIRT